MTMFVNLNMASVRPSANESIGRRLGSLSNPTAIAKMMLKTTTWRTWPSATAWAMFSGKRCRMISPADVAAGLAAVTCSAGTPGGNGTPTPALLRLMAAKPINRAAVVTSSK